MKFTANRRTLLNELALVQGVVERKNTIPILATILIQTHETDNRIRITGTDLDLAIKTQTDANVQREGAICAPAKWLFDVVKSLPEGDVVVDVKDTAIHVQAGKSKFKREGYKAENFPEVEKMQGAGVELPAKTISAMIARTSFCTSTDESRFALAGVHFELNKNGARIVATDGNRCSLAEKVDANYEGEDVAVIVPLKTAKHVEKFGNESDGTVIFSKNDNHLSFKFGDRELISRTVSGQFPNYAMFFPKAFSNSALVKVDDLRAALGRVVLASDDRSKSIKVLFADNLMTLSASSADAGESSDELAIEYACEAGEAGFNAQYLIDYLNLLSGGDVTIKFNTFADPFVLYPTAGGQCHYRYVVMPMRLKKEAANA